MRTDPNHPPSWKVLLIGGNSGAGKSTVARELGRRLELPWLMVDDLRLLLERNIDASESPALHYFDDLDVYQHAPEQVAGWRVANAEATSDRIEIVIANHASHGGPAIIEGDDIVPALAVRRNFAGLDVGERDIRSVFLIEDDEVAIITNMRQRGRRFIHLTPTEQETQVRSSRLYGRWLAREAIAAGLPVLSPRPWETLADRILDAIDAPPILPETP